MLNPEKKFADFHPGEPLEDVFTTYRNVSLPGADAEKFKVISHVEQLARSTCSRMSNGKLWCGTCHDPHSKPVEPVAYFRSKCLSCHTQNFQAAHPDKSSNCIGCHMPRRDAKDGGHTAFTDHRIQRRPTQGKRLCPPMRILQRGVNLRLACRSGISASRISTSACGAPVATVHREGLPDVGGEVQTEFANDDQIFTSIHLDRRCSRESKVRRQSSLSSGHCRLTLILPLVKPTPRLAAYLQAGDQRPRCRPSRTCACAGPAPPAGRFSTDRSI